MAHLTALGSALPGKLELVNADLLKEGDFDEICRCGVRDHCLGFPVTCPANALSAIGKTTNGVSAAVTCCRASSGSLGACTLQWQFSA